MKNWHFRTYSDGYREIGVTFNRWNGERELWINLWKWEIGYYR